MSRKDYDAIDAVAARCVEARHDRVAALIMTRPLLSSTIPDFQSETVPR